MGEVMAMTEHRNVGAVMGIFRRVHYLTVVLLSFFAEGISSGTNGEHE